MKKYINILYLALFALGGCNKKIDLADIKINHPLPAAQFVKYAIAADEHYCDKNNFTLVNYAQQAFIVKFDSSAIYKTTIPRNQYDINKLFGFSDNNSPHHQFSARFGWRWSDGALRLFSYVYNDSTMTFNELGTVAIGAENLCSIKVNGNKYIFTLNGSASAMPRTSKTKLGQGYKLYPYFGGDEVAPHTISIWIKEL